MSSPVRPITILYAEDDEEDRLLAEIALKRSRLDNKLRFVKDGEELLDYLHRQGPYADPQDSPRPGLVLLDLNMPRKDGREALKEIKADPELRRIPVVVLTTSQQEEDILRSYNIGANSYITKPVTLEKLVQVIQGIGQYWFQLVDLPPGSNGH